jgi:hypothetical protein
MPANPALASMAAMIARDQVKVGLDTTFFTSRYFHA